MFSPKLDERIRVGLGESVHVFAEPQRLNRGVGFMGLLLGGFFGLAYAFSIIDAAVAGITAIWLAIVLGATWILGYTTQFSRPYMATGSNGVAFPLACTEIIPWSKIKSIETYQEETGGQRNREQHVAVALSLHTGSLDDYGPTWRSRNYFFGYRSFYERGIVLLSNIYCSLSPKEVLDNLASAKAKAARGETTTAPLASLARVAEPSSFADRQPATAPRLEARAPTVARPSSGGLFHYFGLAIIALALGLMLSNSEEQDPSQNVGIPRPDAPALTRPNTNAQDAVRIFEEAARYETGDGIPRDLPRAIELYERAAGLGNTDAMTALGSIFADGDEEVRDGARGYEWTRRAAEAGNITGMANLGWFYETGAGVAQNYEAAFAWSKKAAEMGHDDAMNRLGLLYAEGQGTPKDLAAAMHWFERAAEKNNMHSIHNLGWLYIDGKGGEKDEIRARSHFEKAANLGNAVSAWELAVLLDEGRGGPAIPTDAAARLLEAAERGNADAIEHLQGPMEQWTEATRYEVKVILARRGLYLGALSSTWDDEARAAAGKLSQSS